MTRTRETEWNKRPKRCWQCLLGHRYVLSFFSHFIFILLTNFWGTNLTMGNNKRETQEETTMGWRGEQQQDNRVRNDNDKGSNKETWTTPPTATMSIWNDSTMMTDDWEAMMMRETEHKKAQETLMMSLRSQLCFSFFAYHFHFTNFLSTNFNYWQRQMKNEAMIMGQRGEPQQGEGEWMTTGQWCGKQWPPGCNKTWTTPPTDAMSTCWQGGSLWDDTNNNKEGGWQWWWGGMKKTEKGTKTETDGNKNRDENEDGDGDRNRDRDRDRDRDGNEDREEDGDGDEDWDGNRDRDGDRDREPDEDGEWDGEWEGRGGTTMGQKGEQQWDEGEGITMGWKGEQQWDRRENDYRMEGRSKMGQGGGNDNRMQGKMTTGWNREWQGWGGGNDNGTIGWGMMTMRKPEPHPQLLLWASAGRVDPNEVIPTTTRRDNNKEGGDNNKERRGNTNKERGNNEREGNDNNEGPPPGPGGSHLLGIFLSFVFLA
jgi:hypothetical protein